MVKKFFYVLSILLISAISVNAETITGIALTDFSTENPKGEFSFKVNEGFTIDNMVSYKEGTVFYGKVIKVVNGQIGKRKGYFVVKPTHYTSKDNVYKMENSHLDIKVSFYKPFDKEQSLKNLANTGVSVAASTIFHIPFLSQGVSFVKGAVISPEENTNRIVSGVKTAYKESPLSYVEKGEALVLHPGQEINLNINEE